MLSEIEKIEIRKLKGQINKITTKIYMCQHSMCHFTDRQLRRYQRKRNELQEEIYKIDGIIR